MNEKNQRTIIYLLGIALYITLGGSILMVLTNEPLETIVVFTGIATAIVTALVTFLQGKKLSEKEAEIIEQYTILQGGQNENMDDGEDVQ